MYSNTSSDMISHVYEIYKESSDPIEQQYAQNILEICGGTIDEMDNDYIVVVKCK